MPDKTSPYSTPRHALILHARILAGTDDDGKPAEYARRELIEAAWAIGHDLAAEKYGDDRVPDWFTDTTGKALMDRLQNAPEGTSAAELLGIVKAHLGIEDEAKEPEPEPEGHE
jgi:hypothetical protein